MWMRCCLNKSLKNLDLLLMTYSTYETRLLLKLSFMKWIRSSKLLLLIMKYSSRSMRKWKWGMSLLERKKCIQKVLSFLSLMRALQTTCLKIQMNPFWFLTQKTLSQNQSQLYPQLNWKEIKTILECKMAQQMCLWENFGLNLYRKKKTRKDLIAQRDFSQRQKQRYSKKSQNL